MALAFSLLEQRRQMKAQKRRKATQNCRNEDAVNNVQELQRSELEVNYECCFLTRACARNPLSDVNVGPKIIFHTCCDKKARISTVALWSNIVSPSLTSMSLWSHRSLVRVRVGDSRREAALQQLTFCQRVVVQHYPHSFGVDEALGARTTC